MVHWIVAYIFGLPLGDRVVAVVGLHSDGGDHRRASHVGGWMLGWLGAPQARSAALGLVGRLVHTKRVGGRRWPPDEPGRHGGFVNDVIKLVFGLPLLCLCLAAWPFVSAVYAWYTYKAGASLTEANQVLWDGEWLWIGSAVFYWSMIWVLV